jgi:hypothetical protein
MPLALNAGQASGGPFFAFKVAFPQDGHPVGFR